MLPSVIAIGFELLFVHFSMAKVDKKPFIFLRTFLLFSIDTFFFLNLSEH